MSPRKCTKGGRKPNICRCMLGAVLSWRTFWNSLKEIGGERHMTLSDLVAAIDSERQHGNLSSAIRLFVLDFYCAQLSEAEGGADAKERLMVVGTQRPYS